jgi:hypothetical protein
MSSRRTDRVDGFRSVCVTQDNRGVFLGVERIVRGRGMSSRHGGIDNPVLTRDLSRQGTPSAEASLRCPQPVMRAARRGSRFP